MKIGEITELLRCQVYRKEDPKGQVLELTPEDFRSVTGLAHFPQKEVKKRIKMEFSSRSDKFVLEQNDILLRTIGSLETIGATCLVAEKPAQPTIPARNLIILRANTKLIDPIWLFYRLSQNDIREEIQKNMKGKRPGYIKNDAIKEIELKEPTEMEIKTTHMAHKRFMEHMWAMENFQNEEKEDWKNLTGIFRN